MTCSFSLLHCLVDHKKQDVQSKTMSDLSEISQGEEAKVPWNKPNQFAMFLSTVSFFKHLFICMYAHVYIHVCHGTHLEVRGQLVGIRSPLPSCGA